MKAKYRHIIFDADHTIIDFNEDERRAFRAAFADMLPFKASTEPSIADIPPAKADMPPSKADMTENAGIPPIDANIAHSNAGIPPSKEEFVLHMQAYSARNWQELGLNNVNDDVIRKAYHRLTYVHVHALFEHAKREWGLKNAAEAERTFYKTLCLPAHPMDGALEIIKALSANYKVSVATNGLSEMQNARLKKFKPYFHRLFISEEVNAIKPSEEFGKTLLGTLQAGSDECLFVGDSLTSDIALANKFTIDAVWYNPQGRPLPEGYRVIAQIKSLHELNRYI